jgi:GTP-binding protein EngB required for normal cell division
MATSDEQTTDTSSTEANSPKIISMNVDTSNFAKVLLIGETGGGKSTFINYLTNYFKGGTLEKLKVAIPTRNFPQQTEGYSHNEINIDKPDQSQTDACRQYLFKDVDTGKTYIFIDTPGLGDTRGTSQHDINLDKIRETVLNLGSLTVVVIFMNGTNMRRNTSMNIILTSLAHSLPDTVMQSVILILTNTKRYCLNFDPYILPLSGSTIYVFTMQNSAFSRPAKDLSDLSESMLQDIKLDWNDSMKEIKDIITQIDKCTEVAVDTLAEMKQIRDAIRAKMHETMLDIHTMQQMQKQLEEYESKSKQYDEDKKKFDSYIKVEKVKRKYLAPSSTLNTVCSYCHMVCHEDCK